MKKKRILFLCVANSARSQMAEGLAKNILGSEYEIWSAGSQPAPSVNPFAVRAMSEVEIDISSHHPKSIGSLPRDFMGKVSEIFTLCAEEVCPVVASGAVKTHWPLPDPAVVQGSSEAVLDAFRKIRDELKERIVDLKKKGLQD